MPKSSNQKLKLIYLMKIFLERTDETHSITMPEIIDALAAYDISAERKSLYNDIENLRVYGLDVIGTQEDRTYSYHIGNRQFELAELKLLVDAVQSSKFITTKKSRELIGKLETLCSKYEATQLHRQVVVTNRNKAVNENIYYNVDIIYNAIAQVYNPKVYADTFSQSPEDVTDLSLPAFEIYEKSKSENGNTIYYGVFYECDYYNLGSDLADLNNPVYSLVKGKSPANLTIDAQGNFVDFEQTPESSNDPYGDIRRVCGPMTELADFLCGETETYSKEPLKVPDLNAEAMVIQYLNYYFCQS